MNSHFNQNEGFRILEDFVCQAIPDQSVLGPMNTTSEHTRVLRSALEHSLELK